MTFAPRSRRVCAAERPARPPPTTITRAIGDETREEDGGSWEEETKEFARDQSSLTGANDSHANSNSRVFPSHPTGMPDLDSPPVRFTVPELRLPGTVTHREARDTTLRAKETKASVSLLLPCCPDISGTRLDSRQGNRPKLPGGWNQSHVKSSLKSEVYYAWLHPPAPSLLHKPGRRASHWVMSSAGSHPVQSTTTALQPGLQVGG